MRSAGKMLWLFSSPSEKSNAIDTEIALLESLISLQKHRLELLREERGSCSSSGGGNSCSGALAYAPAESSSTGINRNGALPYYFTEQARWEANNTLVEARLLTFKVRDYGKSRPSYRTMKIVHLQLIFCIDTRLKMTLYSVTGRELVSLPLEHGESVITAVAHDGDDINYPTIATASKDGSVHMIGLEIVSSGAVVAGIAAKRRVTANATERGRLNGTAFTVKASIFAKFKVPLPMEPPSLLLKQQIPPPYAVVMKLRSRTASSTRERVLHIVDNSATLHRVNTTGFPRVDSMSVFSVERANRNSQVLAVGEGNGHMMALATGEEIALVSTSAAFRRVGTCYMGGGGGEGRGRGRGDASKIAGLAFGVGTGQSRYLYVLLQEEDFETVLKFDTKSATQRVGGAPVCHFVSVLVGGGESSSRNSKRHKKKTLKGYIPGWSSNVLFSHNGYLLSHKRETCMMRAYNISSLDGATFGDKALHEGSHVKSCLVDASLPIMSLAGTSTSGISGVFGGSPSNPMRPSLHSYGHASGDRFLLVVSNTRLVLYNNHIPLSSQEANAHFGFGFLVSMLKGPALLLVVGLFLLVKMRGGGRDKRASGGWGSLVGRERERGRGGSTGGGKQPARQSPEAPGSLDRLHDETQRLYRFGQLCPRDLDENMK